MKNSTYWWLGLILAASVLLRLGVALYLGDVVDAPSLLTDQRSYHALGERLIQGYGFSFSQNWYPFTPANVPTAHWSFLYSLFVAGVYALFGVHLLAVRLVQAILGGILLPWLVYRLARRAVPLSFAIPLLAAAVVAFYAYYILYAATLMTETFYIVTLVWSLEVGLRAGECLRSRREIPRSLILQLGVSLGLAALLRQAVLPWVPIFWLWLLWQAARGQRLGAAVKMLVVASLLILACILPWTYRNYQVYGRFLLLNSNAGYAMYSAQHPMHGDTFHEFKAAPLPAGWWGRSEPELDRALLRLGLQFVVDDPGRYARLTLSRLRAYFEFWPTTNTSLLHNLGRVGAFGLCLPFMLYGIFLVIRQRQLADQFSLLLLFVLFYTALHVLTWAMVRYRLPVDAVLTVMAALALHTLFVRGRNWLSARFKFQRPVARSTGVKEADSTHEAPASL